MYPGNPLQVHFDYLEALILGEKGEFKAFQSKLQAIVDNYPETEIAKQANKTIELLKIKNGEVVTKSNTSKYNFNAASDHFYMLVVPKNTEMTLLKIAFLNYNKSFFPAEGLKVTTSLLGDDYQLLIVNNFKSLDVCKSYIKQMQGNSKFFTDAKITDSSLQYIISKENFSILITEKVLSEYQSFFKTNYTF